MIKYILVILLLTLKVEAENSIRFRIFSENNHDHELLENFNILVLKEKITIEDFESINCLRRRIHRNQGYIFSVELSKNGKDKLHKILKEKKIRSILFISDDLYFEVPITKQAPSWAKWLSFKTNVSMKTIVKLENDLNAIILKHKA